MIGAAMRLKACLTLRRLHREAIDELGRDVARRSRFDASSERAVCRAGVLAALVVAAGLTAAALSGFITPAHGPLANRAVEASQDCSARYAALLDLAELARRDGKSSEVVVRGLSDRGGAMSECLPMSRSAPAPP
ncbi:hypothetical protein LMG28614_00258 [Paraburkholderia ultramafica]|uniref:Uncharacterized protein n=1 Tax=Paraburkholderia ultramafica TaxID=1544867 RepID=A0A6S7ATK3_9BURK|nr:hypothetical protein [Paraburkholderia ultramafica]CAB3776656.1 hypothetical protein LMG28614_00258 [Paraburkholderia ultramafica]